VEELALLVKKKFSNHVVIEKIKTNDNRSYHISSKKIFNDIGFAPQKNIEIAVEDLIKSFNKNLFKRPLDNEMYFNIKRMKSIQLR
jgi:dTDP-D-glucose 4,6-dehydratase